MTEAPKLGQVVDADGIWKFWDGTTWVRDRRHDIEEIEEIEEVVAPAPHEIDVIYVPICSVCGEAVELDTSDVLWRHQ